MSYRIQINQERPIGVKIVTHGGPGSGNFGHAGRPGERGGSGSSSGAERKTFEAATAPLRKKLKFGDSVVALDSKGQLIHGAVSSNKRMAEGLVGLTDADGKEHFVLREELRMPKGGHKTQGE